jgi:hypothetical protein
MACSGALASAGMSTTELALGVEFCAAFNRGVALNTADWYNPVTYYAGAVKNDYAETAEGPSSRRGRRVMGSHGQ